MQGTLKFLKLLLVGAVLLSLAPSPGAAQSSDMERLFSVTGIKVDEQAGTAARARTTALTKAEEEAFRLLLRRLIASKDLDRFYMPEGAEAADYVLGIEVVEEARSRVRYIATLDITFDQEKIHQLLGAQQIAYIGIAPKPALVIPLKWRDGAWLLWEEENTFAALWGADLTENRITSYRFLEGSIAERAAITPGLLLEGRGKMRLQSLAARYGVNEIVVVSARLPKNTSGEIESLEMEVFYPLSSARAERFSTFTGGFEDEESLLRRGIGQFLANRDETWKAQAMTQFGEALELALIVPVSSEGVWAETLKRLAATPVIQDVTIIRMAMPESYLVIRFAGNPDQLALALAQKGLILMESERGWALLREEDAAGMIATRGE